MSRQDAYALIDRMATDDGTGIPSGIGGIDEFAQHAVFYVGAPDAEGALTQPAELGGTRVMGPATNSGGGGVVVGHFTNPEGNLIGVAGAV